MDDNKERKILNTNEIETEYIESKSEDNINKNKALDSKNKKIK